MVRTVRLNFKFDFRFVELEWELHGLGWFREKLEDLLLFQKDQEELRLKSELAKLDDPAEQQAAWETTGALIDEVMPRFSRGPYLISLWALFESGMTEIAGHVAKAKHLTLKLDDISARGKVQQWKRYFEDYADFPLRIEEAEWTRLDELKDIRNLLAHANGRLDLNTDLSKKVRKWCKEGKGLTEGSRSLIISNQYAKSAHKLVSEVLSRLISCIKQLPSSA